MTLRLLLVLLTLAALVTLAPAARAADRLDALVMQLRERPLAIDPELSWFLDDAAEARLVRVLKDSPVPFHVALVPQFEDDESGGEGDRIAATLHRRLRRTGLYLVIDQYGYFEARAYAVPRRVQVTYSLDGPPVGDKLTADAIVDRVDLLVRQVATAPAGQTTDDLPLRRLRGYKEPYTPRERASTAEVALWTAFGFGVLGGIAGGVARVSARREQRRGAARPFWRRLFR